MAFACVKSVPRSPADFRAYAAMLGFGYDSDGKRVIGVKASELMETMVDKAEDRIKRGLPPAETLCERSYMYPDSASDAWLVSGLVSAVRQMQTRNLLNRLARRPLASATLSPYPCS